MRLSRYVLVAVILVGGSAGWFALRLNRERRDRAELARAERELSAGRLALAREIAEGRLARRGDDGEALPLLGRCEEARGQLAVALPARGRGPARSPPFAAPPVRRARVLPA